jgi:hypothetical protein
MFLPPNSRIRQQNNHAYTNIAFSAMLFKLLTIFFQQKKVNQIADLVSVTNIQFFLIQKKKIRYLILRNTRGLILYH